MASLASSPSPATASLLELPDELLGQRIVAHPALDPAARLALFRSCHTLARLVLLHAPGITRLAYKVSSSGYSGQEWSATLAHITLAHLLGTKWQPLPAQDLDLELRVESDVGRLPPPPSCVVSQHITRLHLEQLTLTVGDVAAWQLHDPARWPHLQHLTIWMCTVRRPAATVPAQPLPPIPGLVSFSWGDEGAVQGVQALLPLAANATHAYLDMELLPGHPALPPGVVERLPHLTHLRAHGHVASVTAEELLRHPTLAHVTVDTLLLSKDRSRQPCRWRTLTMEGGIGLVNLAMLPLAGLERLTIAGRLGGGSVCHSECAAGLAELRRLHSEGRLALLPSDDEDALAEWSLAPGDGVFNLFGACEWMPALLRLVLEAGRGEDVLALDPDAMTLPCWRDEVVPLLRRRRQGAGIGTLCVRLAGTREWCNGLLEVVPACIARIRVAVGEEAHLAAPLVFGAQAAVRHPLTLTLLHRGSITPDVQLTITVATALVIVRVDRAGREHWPPKSLLKLEVVRLP